MVIFYKKWKKYNEFQLTKNKMDLNIRKMTNHPPSPDVTTNWSLNKHYLLCLLFSTVKRAQLLKIKAQESSIWAKLMIVCVCVCVCYLT